MRNRTDQQPNGSDFGSAASAGDSFNQASTSDVSKYSRYSAQSRYAQMRREQSANALDADAGRDGVAGPLSGGAADGVIKDPTPAHGLRELGETPARETSGRSSRRQAVGPRAERLSQTARSNNEREIVIPTASETIEDARPAKTPETKATTPDASPTPPPVVERESARPAPVTPATTAMPRATTSRRRTPTSRAVETPVNDGGASFPPIGVLTSSSTDETQFSSPTTYVEKTRTTRKRRRRRIIAIAAACVCALVLCGVGFAFAFVNNVNNNLQSNVSQETLDALETEVSGEPFYMLLMGTDGSEERRESAEYAGDNFRSDSMMLLRVDPQNRKVACVSLIRDTKMDFGEYGIQKLNAAHAIGGTDYTIQTVSKLAGVPISHYAIIDFDGFKEVIDALGGVEVDVQMEIDDDMAGGHVDAGLQTLNGDQALILCRSRHAYDDIGDGDRYRAANQRMVIAAIAKKVLSSDVSTMFSTVEKLSKYIETDFNVMDIVGLGNSMRGINMENDFYTAVMPTESEYSNDTWWEILDKTAWKKMMSRIDQGLPPLEEDVIDPYTGIVIANSGSANSTDGGGSESGTHSGTVAVRNGCGTAGVAAEAAQILDGMGFSTDTANASSSDFDTTTIVYENASQKNEAQQIADELGVGEVVQNDNAYIFNTDFLVVIGADWPSA